ncbi:9310_t:CDS:2, partial [Acaulospora colombiana]
NEDTKRKREENAKLREMARRKELGLPMDEEEMRRFDEERRFIGPSLSLVQRANSSREGDGDGVEALEDANGVDSDDEYVGVVRTTTRAPQIRYNQDEIVLDETQLQYDRQAEADAELASRGPVEVIIETDRDKFTNFASFPRKPRPDRWSKEETETFYLGLRMFHTGFDLIARLLPNRTRTMVRNKFRAEDKKNPQKITHLLSNKMRLPYDLELLSRETGHDFSGPIPQVEIVNPVETSKEGEESDKEETMSVKLRQSTAPPSGMDSDRGEGTSISTNRGRPVSKAKEKRRPSKSSKPRSSSGVRNDPQAMVVHNAIEKPEESTSRPPAIIPSSTRKAPVIRSVTSSNGGRLVMPRARGEALVESAMSTKTYECHWKDCRREYTDLDQFKGHVMAHIDILDPVLVKDIPRYRKAGGYSTGSSDVQSSFGYLNSTQNSQPLQFASPPQFRAGLNSAANFTALGL